MGASTPKVPQLENGQVPAAAGISLSGVRSWALPAGAEQGAEFAEPVALAVDVDDRDVMQQAVEDRGSRAESAGDETCGGKCELAATRVQHICADVQRRAPA